MCIKRVNDLLNSSIKEERKVGQEHKCHCIKFVANIDEGLSDTKWLFNFDTDTLNKIGAIQTRKDSDSLDESSIKLIEQILPVYKKHLTKEKAKFDKF